jgi:hypothetical protein
MSLGHGTDLITNGRVFLLDPANISKHGTSPYRNLANGIASITNSNFTVIDNIFRSDCVNSATGTSEFEFDNIVIDTGSVTVQWWMKVTSDPNVDGNNTWRRLIARGGGDRNPFGFVLEETLLINFTLNTTTGNKRHIDGVFTPSGTALNVWEMHTYTYDRSSGIASCYKNNSLVRSGPQTNGTINPTVPGEAMSTLTSDVVMGISNFNSTISGDACLPADLGPWIIYNRALSLDEIAQNFEATKGRYGI